MKCSADSGGRTLCLCPLVDPEALLGCVAALVQVAGLVLPHGSPGHGGLRDDELEDLLLEPRGELVGPGGVNIDQSRWTFWTGSLLCSCQWRNIASSSPPQ